MKTTITLVTLIFSLLCGVANASIKFKSAVTKKAAHPAYFRNALTDIALTKVQAPEQPTTGYATIDLGYVPDQKDGKYVSSYHGKHVTAIVFLSLAAVFLYIAVLFAKAAKDRSNADAATIGITVCAAGFLGFGIPGTILMFRYPKNRPKVKE